jgi:hypothetical protein
MIVAMFAVIAGLVSLPMLAALVVSVASRREDGNWSLREPARGALTAVARRIVAFDADSIDWPRSKAQRNLEMSQVTRLPKRVDATTDAGFAKAS